MTPLSCDKVLVVALHRQRPDQDAVVVRRLYAAIDLHGERLKRAVERASGAEAAKSFLNTGIAGVRYFARSTVVLWGPYDAATFYLADDTVSVLRIGSSCGASSHELLFGPLFGTDEENAEALQALLGDDIGKDQDSSRMLVLFSRVKLNDAFLSIGGHVLRAGYAAFVRAKAEASDPKILCLAMNSWSSNELTFVLLGDDPSRLLALSEALEGVSLGQVWSDTPELKERFLDSMATAPRRADGDNVPSGLLRRWTLGRRSKHFFNDPEQILRKAQEKHLVVAARSQLGVHVRMADASVEHQWKEHEALLSAMGRAIDILLPAGSGKIRAAPRGADVLHDIAQLWGRAQRRMAGAGSQPPMISALIQWVPKPGHVDVVHDAAIDLARALKLDAGSVSLSTAGRTTTVSFRFHVPLTREEYLLLYAITWYPRVDPKHNAYLVDTVTTLELISKGKRKVDDEPPRTRSWFPPPRSSTEPADIENASGYLLFEYTRTEELARFEWKKLQALGIGTAESLALTNLFATVQHTVGQPEMFGTMLDVSEVCREIAYNLCHQEYVENEGLFTAVQELTQYTQQAYQQRLQFSAAVDGAPAITGEVPYGISQIIEMVTGVAAVILHPTHVAVDEMDKERKLSTYPIILLSPTNSVAVRGLRSFGVFTLSSSQAMTPMSLNLFFHELGHWMVRFRKSPADLKRRKDEVRKLAEHLIDNLAQNENIKDKEKDKEKDKSNGSRWSADDVVCFLDDVPAHAAWRLLGCGGDMELFRIEFLSAPAMALRTGEPLHLFNAAVDLWAETALHLYVQELLAEEGDSIAAALGRMIGRPGRLEDATKNVMRDIERAVDRALPFAMAQLESAAARSNVFEKGQKTDTIDSDDYTEGPTIDSADADEQRRQAIRKALLRETLRQSFFLSDIDKKDERRIISHLSETLRFLAGWRDRLSAEEELLRAESPAYRELREGIAHGRLPASPPWSVLTPDGQPNLKAFLWVRAILSGVADHFAEECKGRIRHGVRRDAKNRTRMSPITEGIYADFLGGLYRVGREPRTRCLKVHATALVALGEISYRVRAGRIDRYFRYPRAFPRRSAEYRTVLIKEGHEGHVCQVIDVSPVGACIQVQGWTKLEFREKTAHEKGEIVTLSTLDGPVECEVIWWNRSKAPYRLGLKVTGSEPFVEPDWPRGV